MNKTNVFAIR